MKTALVIGATGLIGKSLVNKLLVDDRYQRVKIFVRRTLSLSNPKIEEYIVDFGNIGAWKNQIAGDDFFSAMGTKIKKAGSKEAQYKIDVTYQYEFAKAAAENGVRGYFLVSSVGANARSKLFYTRIKGELEEKVHSLSFNKIRIFRPSLLLGVRDEKRFGEKAAKNILKIIVPIFPFLKNQRPIEGVKVAKAMIVSANKVEKDRIRIYELDEIFELANAGN